jgi:two-component system, NtrC family, response regulator AtoC
MEPTDTSFVEATRSNTGTARLFIEEPGRPPRVLELAPGDVARVGRATDIEIPLDDPRASRLHARIEFDGRAVTVVDLGSSNGTWLGDERVVGASPVPPGALVRIGATHIVHVNHRGATTRPETHGPVVGDPASGLDIIAADPTTAQLFAMVRRFAASDLPVLIQGETGTGKEVVARALHRHSRRAGRPFVAVNCAALPESLAESELFGHERGSFTGAQARKPGLFEAADGGTLLLDEVGELSASNQARLLRVLQERAVHRVGALRPTPVDVRVLGATNRDLAVDVARGRFREDLYFRLNGVTLQVPPLRERPGDVLPLARRGLDERGGGYVLAECAVEALRAYPWPGNVRELRNAVECAAATAEGSEIRAEHLPPAVRRTTGATDETSPLRARVDETERRTIVAALAANNNNQSRAARDLGISRRALIYKMERYGLKPPPGSDRDLA